jgi:hypothetical protein
MAYAPPLAVSTTYRGFKVVIDHRDICVYSPDGDLAFFGSMESARCWVRRKRKALGMPGKG